jgi:hypothetical protein
MFLRHTAAAFFKNVQEQQELLAPSVQDPVERAAVVAAKLAQFTFYLRTIGKRKMWLALIERVETLDLPVYRELDSRSLQFDELIYGFCAIRPSIKLRGQTSSRGTYLGHAFRSQLGFLAKYRGPMR